MRNVRGEFHFSVKVSAIREKLLVSPPHMYHSNLIHSPPGVVHSKLYADREHREAHQRHKYLTFYGVENRVVCENKAIHLIDNGKLYACVMLRIPHSLVQPRKYDHR
jgi:hypothetical protein